jgi:competence protein ComEC
LSDAGGDHRNDARQARAGQRVRLRRFPFVRPGIFAELRGRAGFLRIRLGAVFEREMEAGRGFLWLPVFFGTGILFYFALPREPSALALSGVAAILVFASWRSRHQTNAFRVALVAASIACGMTAMKLRTDWVAAPMLARDTTTTVTGWIAAREEASHGAARLHLRVHDIAGLAASATPRTVRVTVRSGAASLAVGDAVAVKAELQPASGPVIPGGFDFARAAFYDGVGAVGFAYGAAKPAGIGPAPLDIRLWRPLAALREIIRVRIEEALAGDSGHIAAALIMGDQGGIAATTQDAMRASGLGHVLSISGLHMALVAGSAFWLIRALLALSAKLALTRPIKKWAAAGGLAVSAFYLGISGGGIATERSFIMLAIMLTAVLVDRRAITLRNVALAALVVLAFNPESLITASFQMSFAATVALVAGYEAITARADRRLRLTDSIGPTILGRAARFGIGLFLTSLIAGLATTPFAVYHFQRLAPLTLVANLAAMPAVGLIVMPMALAAVIVMPFGLEVLPLSVMKWGLDWMVWVAKTVAAWSEGAGDVPMAPAAALILVVAGFLWLALWRERWRLAGLVPILAALPLALLAPRPDILVDESGTTVAVRGADGRYQIMGGKGARFEIENWLRADADSRDARDHGLSAGVACDPLGCIAKLADGGEVALVQKPDAFAEDCRLAAVVVSRLAAPKGCAGEATVIDRAKLETGGAHALYRRAETPSAEAPGGLSFTIETAYPAVRRPFMPPGVATGPADEASTATVSNGE